MTFEEILAHVLTVLQREKRVSYRALKVRFQLDDDLLEAVKDELIYAKKLALDEENRVLVWTGDVEGTIATASQPDTTSQPPPQITPPLPEPRIPEAERRQLTVMFCDLVDSTALSGQLDPEDLREVVRASQHVCSEVITQFDGHVAQLLGDGLLVYFGYPQAHEDDAQRAVRTGLGILDAMEDLNTRLKRDKGIQLALRLGIHTGLVVVGAMGSGGRQEQLALGETPNLASRIQGLAAPNTVIISGASYRLVQGYFECQDLGAQTLRGVAEPITVYRVLSESGAQNRLDIVSARSLTPLVGREQEVGLLLERWEQVKAGHGHVVLLSGEGGIGKSRLVQVLKDHIAQEPHMRWECRSSSYYQNTALFPITDLFQRLLRFQAEDTKALDDHYELTRSFSTFTIPATLQDSLMARLDRLVTAKGIAQIGAIIGRQFSYALLQTVSQLDESTLQRELGRLVEAELVYQRGLPPQATYTFKHALIQDTASQSLLRSTRQGYHRRIAEVLAERFPETVEHQPELLAHHYTEASLPEQAVYYWHKAAQRAGERSAHVEAIAHLRQGLTLLQTLPETPDHVQRDVDMHIALGASLIATKGYAAPEVGQTYTRARQLCQHLEEPQQLFPVLRGLLHYYNVRAEYQTAHALGEQLLTLAQQAQDAVMLMVAHRAIAYQGQVNEGIAQLLQGLTAWRATGAELARPYFLALLAEAYEIIGQPEAGLTALAEALTLADTTGERWYQSELYRLKGELLLQQSSDHQVEAESCFHHALAIAQNQSAKSWELRAATSLARLWQSQGKHEEARQLLGDVYGWFTEGFDTADLKDAKTLLDTLG